MNNLLPHNLSDLLFDVVLIIVVIGLTAMCWRRPRQWYEDQFFERFPLFDLILGAIAVTGIYAGLEKAGAMCYLLGKLSSDGITIYGAMLGAFTALLGFAAAVLAIVCTVVPATQPHLRMTSGHQEKFMAAFTMTLRTLGGSTLLCLSAIFLNYAQATREALFLAVLFLVAVVIPGLVRSALVLEQVVRVVGNLPARRRHRPQNKPISPEQPAV